MSQAAPPSGRPGISPVLVGRAQEVELLERAVRAAQRGTGQIVFIAGDAGLGKSRLLAEVRRRPVAQPCLPLLGTCSEQDMALPYAPILEALRPLLGEPAPAFLVADFRPPAADLAGPALGWPEHASGSAFSAAAEQRRLFEGLARVLIQQAAQQPLLLMLEDLHWSDESSLDFLHFFARRLAAQPICLVATYRQSDAPPRLTHLLAQLDRARLAQELTLAPLTQAEVSDLLGALLDPVDAVRSEWVEQLYRLTEGNPFFVEEVLRALVRAGEAAGAGLRREPTPLEARHIPRSVKDAVQRRSAQLSPGARQALTLSAVAGRRFDFTLLSELTGMPESILIEHMKALVDAQLVVEESADIFAFRHALTREAVYATLLKRERRRYHQQIAETLERLYAGTLDAHLADLADHYYQAESWDKALEYARRAGARAQAIYAPREAVAHLTRALDAARRLAQPVPAALWRARGQAYETLGDFEAARADYGVALAATEAAGDGRAAWQGYIDLGFLWAARDYKQTGDYFWRALALARTLDDPPTLAHSLNRLGNWLMNTGAAADSLRLHQEALETFQRQQDRPGMAETLDLLGMASAICGDIPASVEYYGRAIELFRQLGHVQGLVASLSARGTFAAAILDETTYGALGTLEALAQDAAEALSRARQISWAPGEVFAGFTAGSAYAAFGQFGRALEHAHAALRLAHEIEHQQWTAGAYTHLGQIYVFMRQPATAIQALEAARPLVFALGSAWWVSYNSTYLALAYLLAQDPARAAATLRAAMPANQAPRNLPERRLAWAWGEVALANGDYGAALRHADQLLASVPGATRAQPVPALLKLKGEALASLDRLDEAQAALEDARRGAAMRGAPPLLWPIHAALGRLHQRRRDRASARREFDSAREIVQALAATLEDGSLRVDFLRSALRALPQARPLSPGRSAAQAYASLTARERQIAALIAQGQSNREIASALVITTPTVKTHIGHILAKLGFTARAQVAAWAVEKGLVEK